MLAPGRDVPWNIRNRMAHKSTSPRIINYKLYTRLVASAAPWYSPTSAQAYTHLSHYKLFIMNYKLKL